MSREGAAPASSDAAARIARTHAENPHAVALARLLSLAVPIEAALMRAIRLKLLPAADVGAEADLWFSPLVETRSRDGIMLLPAVAEELRKHLANEQTTAPRAAGEPTLARRCWDITRELHDFLPPAVRLEEELNFLSLDPERNEARIRELITSALVALIRDRREEVANWAGRALPRLPQVVRDSDDAHMLAAASDLRLGRSLRASYLSGDKPIPSWFSAVLPTTGETKPLGVSVAGTMLVLDPRPPSDAQHIIVPATDPRVVQVDEPGAGRDPRIVFVDANAVESVPLFGRGAIELTTLAGDAYAIERIAGDTAAAGLACVAYANCNQALMAWQLASPLPGLLGFALERIDAGGAGETIRNVIGFTRVTAQMRRPLSKIAPIQRFTWIDRPPRRSAAFRYRITPLVGAPGKLEAVESLEVRSPPVAIEVTRQGAFTALFNPAPNPARREWRTKDAGAELRAFLGGEVRRVLLALLQETFASGDTAYVALSRLNDPEVIAAIARLGRRAYVLLGAGRLTRDDQLAGVREALAGTQLSLRTNASGYAHSHFMVVCDGSGRPRSVWTGSMSWTAESFYGRDANALIISDADVAARYLQQWHRLRDDPPGRPMMAANETAWSHALADGGQVTLWFTPQLRAAELDDLRRRLAGARTAILFALGARPADDMVLGTIMAHARRLYVAGVNLSQDGKRISVHQHATELGVTAQRVSDDAFKAAGLRVNRGSLPIGSRLIVIDPFDDDPVVIAGSHPLSPGSSRRNDDDLLIIRGNRALAIQCTVHIKGLVDHHAFRARGARSAAATTLSRNDRWQSNFGRGEAAKELAFWMGALVAAQPDRSAAGGSAATPRPRTKRVAKATKKSTKAAKKAAKATKQATKPARPAVKSEAKTAIERPAFGSWVERSVEGAKMSMASKPGKPARKAARKRPKKRLARK